jgi:hypothetical protein
MGRAKSERITERLPPYRTRWVVAIGVAEAVLTVAICTWMSRADPDTLIKVSRELMAVGIVGAIAMGVITGFVILSHRGPGGGGGGMGSPESDPFTPVDDLDAELRQLIEEGQRELSVR